jgi:hypothetical protein
MEEERQSVEGLNQKPQENYSPTVLEQGGLGNEKKSSSQVESNNQTSQKEEQKVSQEEQKKRIEQEEIIRQTNLRRDQLNQSTPLHAVGMGMSIINRKKIDALTKQSKEKTEEREKIKKHIKKMKRKMLFQAVRVGVEAVTTIGIPGAVLEFEKYLEKKDKIKQDKKRIQELDAEIRKLEVQMYNLSNLLQMQEAQWS